MPKRLRAAPGSVHSRDTNSDALIAATAMVHNLTLATANTDDFRWIDGLRLVNPLQPRPVP